MRFIFISISLLSLLVCILMKLVRARTPEPEQNQSRSPNRSPPPLVVRGCRLLDRGFVWRGRRLDRAAGRRLDLVSLMGESVSIKISQLILPISHTRYYKLTAAMHHASHGPPFSLLMLARILL